MKLFLASSFNKVSEKFLETINKSPNDLRVGFIATAADPYDDKWFIEDDRNKFIELGFNIVDFDLKEKIPEEVKKFLDSIDIVFFAGGNTNYLLKYCHDCGLNVYLREYLENGLIYIGSSAGSIIAGSSTEPFWDEEKNDLKEDFEMKDFSGLGLVDYVIIPHQNKEEYKKEADIIMKKYGDKFKFKLLCDDEVVILNLVK